MKEKVKQKKFPFVTLCIERGHIFDERQNAPTVWHTGFENQTKSSLSKKVVKTPRNCTFHEKIILQFFSWNWSVIQLNSAKPLCFHDFFSNKNETFFDWFSKTMCGVQCARCRRRRVKSKSWRWSARWSHLYTLSRNRRHLLLATSNSSSAIISFWPRFSQLPDRMLILTI